MHCPAMQPECNFVHVQDAQMKFNNTEHETTRAFAAVAVALRLALKEDWSTMCQIWKAFALCKELVNSVVRYLIRNTSFW